MKVCITAKKGNLDAELDPRFGRAQCYLVYNTETKESKIISNESINAAGGAGTAAAQLMTNEGVDAVISGNFGPNAANGLKALNIQMYTSPVEIVSQVIEKFMANKLAQVSAATVEGKHSL